MNTKIIFGSTLLLSVMAATSALASEQPQQVAPAQGDAAAASPFSTFQVVQTDENAEQAQVTSVSQLSDVQPTDWAFQALQSLVERYGCIAGYPNGTFKGNRAATRYELAAALNACLDQISDKFATKEDLATVKALQEEFKAELATLKGRVDGLEARTATLEAQQFSTTTKLSGEVIFQGAASNNTSSIPSGTLGQLPAGTYASTGDNVTFLHRATLSLLTSFTGKDLLITSLQEGTYGIPGFGVNNDGAFAVSGYAGTLAPSLNQVSTGNVGLYYLGYRFPVFKDKGTVFITAVGGELSDFTDTLNPAFDSDGQGSLSGFGIRNPIYRHISGKLTGAASGTGAGANFNITDKLNLAVGYLAPSTLAAQSAGSTSAAFSGDNNGLFGGDYGAIAQITFKPSKNLGLGLTYVRSYQNSVSTQLGGGSGTFRANFPFLSTPTSANSVGFEFNWQPSTRVAFSGWAGATFAQAEASNAPIVAKGNNATILNGALAVSFPDLFMKGNMGGIIVGVEPQVVSNNSFIGKDNNTNIHLEGLYRFKVNDNISITPGVIAVVNPEGNSANDTVIIGTVRTTFTF
jgi:Carbohydrate-selective porin, OprB family/S-layer homology domain